MLHFIPMTIFTGTSFHPSPRLPTAILPSRGFNTTETLLSFLTTPCATARFIPVIHNAFLFNRSTIRFISPIYLRPTPATRRSLLSFTRPRHILASTICRPRGQDTALSLAVIRKHVILRASKFVTCEQLEPRVSEHLDQQNGCAAVRPVTACIHFAALQRNRALVFLLLHVHLI
jgi:hypothetical protein